MIRKVLTLITIICLLFSCKKSDKDILIRSISKLNSLKTIEYYETFHWLNIEQGFDIQDSAKCFFDFTSSDTLLGARFQFLFKQGEQVYNGKELFQFDKTEEKILYYDNPSDRAIYGSMLLYNSVIILKKILPKILKNSSVELKRQNDTLINGE